MATIFWSERLTRLVWPMPPTPTPATLRRSLGGVWPRPRTWRGTIVKAAAAVAVFAMKERRETMEADSLLVAGVSGAGVSDEGVEFSKGVTAGSGFRVINGLHLIHYCGIARPIMACGSPFENV